MEMDSEEETFKNWYINNEGSEELRDRYRECCNDLKEVGEKPPTFRRWMRELWEDKDGF